jgi:hypothetical protein
VIKLFALILAALAAAALPSSADEPASPAATATCEQWGMHEIVFESPSAGNPFVEVDLAADFTDERNKRTRVAGFYDGEGRYVIRFSPPACGKWRYRTSSIAPQLHDKAGALVALEPTGDNRGPVRVANQFHFAYADGTPYRPIGTTCYVWTHQPEELQEQTLRTLAEAPFNKLRMCVFPKRYQWNENEPPLYPFEGGAPDRWDFTRFNPEFFRQLERRIVDLQKLGIEADVILLHPYDEGHWGFDRMPDDADDRYLRYLVARLAAYRNVWWSLANEYDFMTEKQESDWDRMIEVVDRADPYDRLTSIHNGRVLYNHTNARLTHASIQNGSAAEDAGRAVLYRDAYRKPIVFDEIKYEGDIPSRWGNLSAEEMVHRFWQCIVAGTYPGHGECYLSDDDVLWWSKGGQLKGESPARIAFLAEILESAPERGLEPIDKWQYPNIAGQPGEYYLVYFGKESPSEWTFFLPRYELDEGDQFQVEVLDTWNMTVTPVEVPFTVRRESEYVFIDKEDRSVSLPGKPWQALRIMKLGRGG